ncbi:MAG: TM2 domain-containing protein [Gemmatimonadota bacterium]
MTDPRGGLPVPYQISPRSRSVALALAIILGWFGAHRFYAGRMASAFAQLFTLGGLGLWTTYDAIMIGTGNFRDEEGRRVLSWDPTDFDEPYGEIPPAVAAELAALRTELDDLHERLDFTERLLTRLPPAPGEERS